jgi:hypothetical protein
MVKKIIAVVLAGVATLALAAPASASSQVTTGGLTKDKVTYYTTGRTITAGGSNIYVQKTDGPAIDVKWYKCGNTGVSGAWVYLQNADPTPRARLGSGFLASTVFCLAAWDHGSNSTDTWTGTVWWNVFS